MNERRLLFVAMPPPEVVAAIQDMLRRCGLERLLGSTLFAPYNCHQSLSGRILKPSRTDISILRSVGERLSAHACTLQFNRIDSAQHPNGNFHVTMRARGRPKAFEALLHALQRQLIEVGYSHIATGVSPHITLSYVAPALLDKIEIKPSVDWTLGQLLLVEGGGSPYAYDILDRWSLLPETDPVISQIAMF